MQEIWSVAITLIDRPDENDHMMIPITFSDLVLGFDRAKSSQMLLGCSPPSTTLLKVVTSAETNLTGVPPAKNKWWSNLQP